MVVTHVWHTMTCNLRNVKCKTINYVVVIYFVGFYSYDFYRALYGVMCVVSDNWDCFSWFLWNWSLLDFWWVWRSVDFFSLLLFLKCKVFGIKYGKLTMCDKIVWIFKRNWRTTLSLELYKLFRIKNHLNLIPQLSFFEWTKNCICRPNF